MSKNKYIVYKTREEEPESIILFEEFIGHDDMFKMVTNTHKNAKIISAGFWDINNKNEIITYGRSVSLNIDSRKEDVTLLNHKFLNIYVFPK